MTPQRFGMPAGRWIAILGIISGLVLGIPHARAEGAVTAAKLETQEGVGGLYLLIFYKGETPVLSIDTLEKGLRVWLSNVNEVPDLDERLELLAGDGGSWLYLPKPGIRITTVTLEKSRVTIRLTETRKTVDAGNVYKFGVGDVITISVFNEEELTGDYTVGPDGRITMPLIGGVLTLGLTDTELKHRITELLAKDFLVDPQISVTCKEYRSQYVYVTGAVPRSSRVPLNHGMTLKDVLSEAGITLSPGQEVVLTRTGDDDEIHRFTEENLEQGELLVLQDGDVLNVKQPAFFFIRGEIRRPGRYELTAGMTLLEAISVAEGLTEWANKKQIRIRRKVNGESSETAVSLKKVEEQKVVDPQLQPGDVILIKRRFL